MKGKYENFEISKKSNRIYYFDVLRCIACLCVVMLHSSCIYAVKDIGSFNFWVGNILDSLTRIGVPLFIMISGALMLDENYDFSMKKIRGHIVKMITFFYFWSAVECLLFKIIAPIAFHEPIQIKECISLLITGPGTFWFVYMIIGLYLITPLLRLWVKKENKKYIKYFIILSMIFNFFIPRITEMGLLFSDAFEKAGEIVDNLKLNYVGGFTTYFILGWYLHNFDIKNSKLIYTCGVIGYIFSMVFAYTINNFNLAYHTLSLHVMASAAMMFTLMKSKFFCKAEKEEVKSKTVILISKYSLGIYAIHMIVMNILRKFFTYFVSGTAIITVPCTFVITVLISLFIAFIMKKLPFFRNFV